MQQFLINELIIGVAGLPVLIFILFAIFISRKTASFKPTENILAFSCMFGILLFLPFFIYFAGVLAQHRGFLGYYAAIPELSSRLAASDKRAFIAFLFYTISIHLLFLVPFMAFFRLLLIRGNLRRLATVAMEDSSSKEELAKLQALAKDIQTERKIKASVELKVVDGIEADKIAGVSNIGIVKLGQKIILIVNERFLQFFSKGLIKEDELKAILHHEFGHIANRDYLIPLVSKIILNRKFVLFICFLLCLYFGATVRYDFFNANSIYRAGIPLSYPLPIIILPMVIAFCLQFGFYLWLISFFLRRCEILSDNSALKYTDRNTLKNAIMKINVFSELGGSMAFPFASSGESAQKKRSLWGDILFALRTMNIFSDYNKTYFHPNLSERIRFLDNPKTIMEEKGSGLMRLDIFLLIALLFTIMSALFFAVSEWVIYNVNLQEANLAIFTNSLYFCFVLLACLPLRYAKAKMIINISTVKLIALYSLIISLLSNLYAAYNWVRFIARDYNGAPAWHVRLYIRTQISHIIDMFIRGFIFSIVLFFIFIFIGNLIIKRKNAAELVQEQRT